jgi:cytochrome c oxidase assembly protein subunit 17
MNPVDACDKPAESCKKEEKLKACCACPETKKKRDECVVTYGELNCAEFIEAHKKCLRSKGFQF